MTMDAGKTLGHYRIVSKLGAGGMGEVWLAEDTRLGRKVALKLLPAEFTEDSERVRRFTQEAKAASALNHPNIISVYDIGECDTGRFIVMEFVAGRTLRSAIAKDNSLETLFTLGAQMARALSAAHAAGITHRDIKPDNIMVRDDGYVKMLDFGLARLLPTTASDPEAMTLAQQTTPGTVMGTLAYMSPEQASGKTAGSASDVFALGIVLYELATGSHPFKSETMIGYLHAITSQVPQSMTSLKSHLPAALDDLILRMLEKDARSRPTATEVVQALQEIEKYGSSNTLPFRVAADKPGVRRGDEGFRIDVLPFKVRDADPSVEVLADGLSEEIVTGLSRFRYLSVVTSTSAARQKAKTEDERTLGTKLGTRYVLEGSIRKGGSFIRVSAQLVDTESGAQLWSETYNRDLQTSTIFAVQDDVAGRIVATVADSYGVLVHSMRDAIRQKDDPDLTPAEWQFQYFAYREQITPSNHAALKSRLERAAKSENRPSDLWACLAQVYLDEYAFGFPGNDEFSLDRALVAARRAVELDRANQFAMVALAQTHFFRQDLAAFGPAAERAMALNPLNTDALGILGLEIVHTAEFERGTTIVRHAMELNPNHAGWMHFAPLWNHFHKGEYEQALECANRVDVPGLFWPYLVMASACGHLGRRIEAAAAVRDLLTLDPEFAAHARTNVGTWHFASGLMNPILEGLRKAGLEIADKEEERSEFSRQAIPCTTEDKPKLELSTPSIAVLPFVNISNDPDNEYFGDGLAEELLNALSKIDGLKVAARTSAFSFKGKNTAVSEIGQRLSVKTVLEGSVRRSGNRLRITVQLVNASDGYYLWSERYDREMQDIFNEEEEITLAVVDALKLKLFSDEKAVVLKRYTDDVEAHELFLKGRYYAYKYTAEGWKRAIEFFEKAIEKQPDFAPAYAGIASSYGCLWFFGFLPAGQTILRSKTATVRALEIDENLADAHLSSAIIIFFYDWEWEKAEEQFKQAIALNPNNAEALTYYALFLAFEERYDEAISGARRALEIDPLSLLINMNVGWAYFSAGLSNEALDQANKMSEIEPDFYGAYWLKGAIRLSEGAYEEAVEELKKAVSLGGRQIVLADLASAHALAGKNDEAASILDQLLEMRRREYVPAICMARIYSRIGENDKAVEWLEKAFEERNGEMVFLRSEIAGAADGDSLNSLGSDPRLIELLRKMRLPQQTI